MNVYCDGMQMVSLLQQQLQDKERLMIWISYLGDPRYCLLVYFPFFFCFDKVLGLKILWASSITEWANAVLKWCFRDDRPYWWTSDTCHVNQLQQFYITCETGPGFPSGHVMGSSSFIVILLLHFQYKIGNTKLRRVINTIFGMVGTVFIILVALSRLYIAAHFPHQVIFGALGGITCAVLINRLLQSQTSLLHSKAIIVSLASMVIAFAIFYILITLGLNPNSSIDKAVKHCSSAEWLHMDTTLFHSIIRSAASVAGVGMFALLIERYHGDHKKEDFFDTQRHWCIVDAISAVCICNIVLHLESYKLPKDNESVFYILSFFKFFVLPLYVIVLKNLSEMLADVMCIRKCKIK